MKPMSFIFITLKSATLLIVGVALQSLILQLTYYLPFFQFFRPKSVLYYLLIFKYKTSFKLHAKSFHKVVLDLTKDD